MKVQVRHGVERRPAMHAERRGKHPPDVADCMSQPTVQYRPQWLMCQPLIAIWGEIERCGRIAPPAGRLVAGRLPAPRRPRVDWSQGRPSDPEELPAGAQ